MKEFRNEIRWTLVVLVLAGLAIYALWPREPGPAPESATPQPPASSRLADPAQRAAAELAPCPRGTGRTELDGVPATCSADGAPVDLGDVVADRPTLVNVWASWCGPCRDELPALQEYAERPGAVRVIGVQVRSDEPSGLDLLRELGVHFPIVHDTNNQVRAALDVPNVVPMNFLVTADGQVRRVEPPEVLTSAEEVDAAVRRTLGQAGGGSG